MNAGVARTTLDISIKLLGDVCSLSPSIPPSGSSRDQSTATTCAFTVCTVFWSLLPCNWRCRKYTSYRFYTDNFWLFRLLRWLTLPEFLFFAFQLYRTEENHSAFSLWGEISSSRIKLLQRSGVLCSYSKVMQMWLRCSPWGVFKIYHLERRQHFQRCNNFFWQETGAVRKKKGLICAHGGLNHTCRIYAPKNFLPLINFPGKMEEKFGTITN